MRTACIKLVALLVLAMAPLAAKAQQLADRVPDDAMLFVSWQGTDKMQPAYQGSHLKAVLDSTSVPEFFQKRLPEILERLGRGNEEQAAAHKQIWQVATLMCKYPTALYVGAMDPKGPPMPRLAILCDAGKDSESLEKAALGLLDLAGPIPIPLALKRNAGIVMLSVGAVGDSAEALILGKPSGADAALPLAKSKAFAAAMAQVNKDPVLTVFVNVPAILKVADQFSNMTPEARENWPKVRDAMNLAGIGEVVLTAGFDGKDWSQQGFIAMPGPRTGVVALLDGAPITDDQLKLIPVSATWAAAFRTDLGRLWTEVVAGIAKTSPEAAAQTRNGIAEANAALGIDIEKDLVASLGDQWVAYTAPNVGGNGLTGIVAINALKDAARLAKAIDTLEARANAAIEQATQRGYYNPFEPKFAIRRSMIAGVEVHHIGVFWINPAWAINNGKLYISLIPQAIPAAIDAATAKTSILNNDAFLAVRKRLGVDKPTSLNFIDLPKTAPDSYPMLSMVVGLAGMFVGPDAPPSLLPPLHKLLPELSPAGSATWTDAAGWHMKSISPIPGSIALSGQQSMMAGGVAVPAMAVAILLPSLGRARTLSNRSYEAANQRGIAQSCVVWANENSDKMPEHLAQLIVAQQISPKQLVSKFSNTKPAELTPAQWEAAQKDWHAIEKIIDEHCDYVYLGKGTENITDASMILVYTKPIFSDSRDGITAAFYDAHAEFIRTPGLKSAFESTNRYRKEKGLPQVEFKTPAAPRFTVPEHAPMAVPTTHP